MTIRNLKQAERALMAYVPPAMRKDITLERVWPLMKLLGNPQDRLKTIHIAGTSGKTSTAYYMAALLASTGQKTGLATSPHIDSITERIQVNGRPISEADFCEELGIFLAIVQGADQHPTYFELLYAFSIWVLERQHVEYLVVETGMGGLHDATNVAARADKVCVITDIGLDHTHLLGTTLPAIAAQKVGIVHDHNHVFMYRQAPEIMAVIEQWVDQQQAVLHILNGQTTPVHADGETAIPAYQERNWALAYFVYQYLVERDHLPSVTLQVLQKTQLLQVPARMDVKELSGKILVMDGAHNGQKMTTFIDSFQQLYPDTRPAVLVGVKDGKEYHELVSPLAGVASRIITTTFKTSQDLPVVSMDADTLAAAFREEGFTAVTSVPDQQAAYRELISGPERVCLITGSFYLLGQIRNNEHIV